MNLGLISAGRNLHFAKVPGSLQDRDPLVYWWGYLLSLTQLRLLALTGKYLKGINLPVAVAGDLSDGNYSTAISLTGFYRSLSTGSL